jgi:hypothetical protein
MGLSAFFLLLSIGQSISPAGLPGDPAENYREAVTCYGVFASTATIQRAIGNERDASIADEKARAFVGLASLAARDAHVAREELLQSLRLSPSAAVEPLRGLDDEAAITAFVEQLNARADQCVAFVNRLSDAAS